MADLGRRSMLIGMCKVGAAGLTAAVLPSAAQSLPLAGLKPAPVGKVAPNLQELAQVVVVHPRRRRRRRRRVCWWHRGRRVCRWR